MKRWPALSLALALLPPLTTLEAQTVAAQTQLSLVHVQPDRDSYRLGETIWFRLHASTRERLTIALLAPDGREVDRKLFPPAAAHPLAGQFFLSDELKGGLFQLEVRQGETSLPPPHSPPKGGTVSITPSGAADGAACGDTSSLVVHTVPLEVYDLATPKLDLRLSVLGDVHYPGDSVTASFCALDARGRPVRGARVEYLATFGQIRIRDSAGRTGSDGRALIRFPLPRNAQVSGHLAVGLTSPSGPAAVARRVAVSSSVARLDAFPEGGTIVAGHAQKLGLLTRDLDGVPTAAEGRIVDDTGNSVNGFRTDRWGLTTVVVPYELERTYHAVIDRPADVTKTFPLPSPTGHDYAMAVAAQGQALRVDIGGSAKTESKPVRLLLSRSGRIVHEVKFSLQRASKKELPVARARVPYAVDFGLADLVLVTGDRVLLRRPVFLGKRSPVDVTIRPKAGHPLVPGRPVELELLTTRSGIPLAADVALSIFQGETWGLSNLATRSLFRSHLVSLPVPPDLLENTDAARRRRDAFLLVHSCHGYPTSGLPLGKSRVPPAGVVQPLAEMAPRAVMPIDYRPTRTVVRALGLERLMERAHFTRSAAPEPRSHTVRLQLPGTALLATPGLGRRSDRPPQRQRIPASRVDSRRTLFWSERIRTDSQGRATIRLTLNHLVSDLTWIAQGRALGGSGIGLLVSGKGRIALAGGFCSRFEFPRHVQVGDEFDLMLEVSVPDGSKKPIRIEVHPPGCLKPLVRTRLTYDPLKDASLHRFRFRAVAPAPEAELRLTATRGLYQEVHRRRFQVTHQEVELTFGESGYKNGAQSYSLTIPPEAIVGSVRLHASVSTGYMPQALESFSKLLQEPTGCFEQFTSKNLVNLVILDALKEAGEDAEVLERAYRLARTGFKRLLTYWNPETKSFAMFVGGRADIRPNLVALRQLALYGRVFRGLGRPELEATVRWVERQKLSAAETLYVTLALHDMGRAWKGSEEVAEMAADSLYEKALLAGCLANWPAEWPLEEFTRTDRLRPLLDDLEKAFDGGRVGQDDSEGVMGSRGGQLTVETIALAVVALDAAGRQNAAGRFLDRLARWQATSHTTQGVALAIRAFGRTTDPLLARSVTLSFNASPGGRELVATLPTRAQPVRFERAVPLGAGRKAQVGVKIGSEEPLPYTLGCSYRVATPRSSSQAPFRVRTRITPSVNQDAMAQLTVHVVPRREGEGGSQVVARIGLPGGVTVPRGKMDGLVSSGTVSHWEIQGSYLNLYWSRGVRKPLFLTVPLRAAVAGRFQARPSVVYPYYETGKEYYAPPLTLAVINTFGNDVRLEHGIRRIGR